MTNVEAYGLLIAILLPFIVGLLTRATWPHWARFCVLLLLSAAVGAGTLYYSGALSFTAETYLVTVMAIVGAGQTVYALGVRTIPGLKDWIDQTLVH
jgi:hypothetical protein